MRRLTDLNFDNSYARLPPGFAARVAPTPVPGAHLVAFNPAAAALLDLDPAEAGRPEFVEVFAGNRPLPGADPVAMLYAGHQFGHYVPQLGDGRAILLGEVVNSRGERWDLHLKGGGETPFSRSGDGRAVLRSTIREYLCSEAMHGLGIPTTRALCIVGTGLPVYRETVETGALLLRLAGSHVRFGSFEVFHHRRQPERVRILADHVIGLHFADLAAAPESERYAAFLREVVLRTARLMADWQAVGFAHGVMNTDNMSITGLTLDYGPFGFLDDHDPGFVCNHSDDTGRYAFFRQPRIALWNLSCLAEALLSLMTEAQANAALDAFGPEFNGRLGARMRAKLGLTGERPGDEDLINGLWEVMAAGRADHTNFFRELARFRVGGNRLTDSTLRGMLTGPEAGAAFDAWAGRYRSRLADEQSVDADRRRRMEAVNPKYVLRNYLAQAAISAATERRDYSEIERLAELLSDPFAERPEREEYSRPPPDWGRRLEVSCSS